MHKRTHILFASLLTLLTIQLAFGQSISTVLSVSSPDVTNIQWHQYEDSTQLFSAIPGADDVLFVTQEEGIYFASFDRDGCHQATSYAQIKCRQSLVNNPVRIVAGSTTSTSYTWLRDGVVLAGEQQDFIDVSDPGMYQAVKDRLHCPTDTLTYVVIGVDCCDTLDLMVLLEGAYDPSANQMTTILNYYHLLPGQDPGLSSDLISQLIGVATPPGQPYSAQPWGYTGTEADLYGDPTIIADPGRVAYEPSVVDWVLVSLRTSTEPSSVIYQCAMLLHADGKVEAPAACECPPLTQGTSYYVVIEHRNHMAVMSDPIAYQGAGLAYDFSSNAGWLLGTGSPEEINQKMVNGRYVMVGGNSDQAITALRGDINALDYASGIVPVFGAIREYSFGDNNLDGDVNVLDQSDYIGENFGLINFVF